MRIKNRNILPRLLITLANGAIAFSNPVSLHRAFRQFEELQTFSDNQLKGSVHHALAQKYIIIKKGKNGKSHIILSHEGKKLVGKAAIENLKLTRLPQWDGKWRIVLFDIPETHKSCRDGFAKNLKKNGCLQIQKSAFAFPFPCAEEISVLADFHEVRPFLTLLVAEYIGSSKKLERLFDLKKPRK